MVLQQLEREVECELLVIGQRRRTAAETQGLDGLGADTSLDRGGRVHAPIRTGCPTCRATAQVTSSRTRGSSVLSKRR